ncbi:MAG: N-acetyltransferase [Actinomycetota bacterium]|nr:N-acetyltransferase [Actinomycetota bacterium]
MEIVVSTLAERPDLRPRFFELTEGFPAFMYHDPTADLFFDHLDEFTDYCFVAVRQNASNDLVGTACSVPFHQARAPDGGLLPLPDGGWDDIIRRSAWTRRTGAVPDAVSALEIRLRPDVTGLGLSAVVLAAMRDNAVRRGFTTLVAPVRPTAKHLEPGTPMSDYAFRVRDDGLPADPWLRTHARLGAVIEKVAPASMVITGSLAQWRSWAGQPFDTDGPTIIEGALVPVLVDVARDLGVYVEPNVWMRHRL